MKLAAGGEQPMKLLPNGTTAGIFSWWWWVWLEWLEWLLLLSPPAPRSLALRLSASLCAWAGSNNYQACAVLHVCTYMIQCAVVGDGLVARGEQIFNGQIVRQLQDQ